MTTGLAGRFLCVAACVALGLAVSDAGAHAVVLDTSLARQPIRAHTAAGVTLRFNSAIEARLSRVVLLGSGGNSQTLDIAAGQRSGELLVRVPGLAAGDYAFKYRIFAGDGHLTEDVIRFRVLP